MADSAATPKPPFDYHAFIEELRPLVKDAADLHSSAPELAQRGFSLHDTPGFRSWNIKLKALLGRIKELGYKPECRVAARVFQNVGYPGGHKVELHVFRRDLEDTVEEMNAVLSYYDKYGDPGPARSLGVHAPAKILLTEERPEPVSPPVAPSLARPATVTVPWLLENVSLAIWWKVVVVLALVFVAGALTGRIPIVASVVDRAVSFVMRGGAPVTSEAPTPAATPTK